VHRFDPPERFVAGTVGPPGQRTFFLQARSGTRVTSVALEKQQVAVLAERIEELLDEVMRSVEGGDTAVPAAAPLALEDNDPLEQPIVEEFRAGTMTLSWDAEDERVVVEVFPFNDATVVEPGTPEDEIEEPEPEEVLLVRLPPGVARAFSARAQAVVSAGREPCPFCGAPLDPSGHLCPRANGFRRTAAQPEE
jgi:uncharacterized repeat protein (TIGR03847 family)